MTPEGRRDPGLRPGQENKDRDDGRGGHPAKNLAARQTKVQAVPFLWLIPTEVT